VLRDRKGGDPSEWPEDLRVREFPSSEQGRVLSDLKDCGAVEPDADKVEFFYTPHPGPLPSEGRGGGKP